MQREAAAPATRRTVDAPNIGWGVMKINAPSVWAAGFTGQGVVIGGEDTGISGIIRSSSRSTAAGTARRPITTTTGTMRSTMRRRQSVRIGFAGASDDEADRHGTHTAGTFAGDDGPGASPRHRYGVAPGAKWIGCRNMDEGAGTPARYIECMQFMIAPTDSQRPERNPDLGADMVSNSWSCPSSEGCIDRTCSQTAVDKLVKAGVFYAAAAQNSGPSCSTITDPPALYDSAFVVGATNMSDQLASFSSLGPVTGRRRYVPMRSRQA